MTPESGDEECRGKSDLESHWGTGRNRVTYRIKSRHKEPITGPRQDSRSLWTSVLSYSTSTFYMSEFPFKSAVSDNNPVIYLFPTCICFLPCHLTSTISWSWCNAKENKRIQQTYPLFLMTACWGGVLQLDTSLCTHAHPASAIRREKF